MQYSGEKDLEMSLEVKMSVREKTKLWRGTGQLHTYFFQIQSPLILKLKTRTYAELGLSVPGINL
jgi:hypothetical protein